MKTETNTEDSHNRRDGPNWLLRLVRHLDAGGQIAASTGQVIYQVKEGEYFMSCDTEFCCDQFLAREDVIEFLNDIGMGWECLPNETADVRGQNDDQG